MLDGFPSPLDGMRSPFGGRDGVSLAAIIAILFGNGEPGFAYDLSDMSTLFQDDAGATPVTDYGQTVGRVLDQTGNGHHATQSNAASRPVYGREPARPEIRNLLTYSQNFTIFSGASVNIGRTLVPAAAPNDEATNRLIPTAVLGTHYVDTIEAGNVLVSNTTNFVTLWVKPNGYDFFAVEDASGVSWINVNLLDGAVGTSGGGATLISKVVDLDGYYKVIVSLQGPINTRLRFAPTALGTQRVTDSWTPDGISGADFWRVQVETGSAATPYQKVTSQWDITEAGVPTVYYLQADGSDDFLVTPTITPGTDKAQVFVGVRKQNTLAVGMILETSAITDSNNGSLFLAGPRTGSADPNWGGRSKGTTAFVDATSPDTYPNPSTNVVSLIADIAGDVVRLRVDGSNVAENNADQGTGNFLAYPTYIFRRGGASLPFNGRLYGYPILRFGPNLDAATIDKVETLIAKGTGVTL